MAAVDEAAREQQSRAWRAGYSESAGLPFDADDFLISHHLMPTAGATPTPAGDLLLPQAANLYMGDRDSYALANAFENVWRPELRRLVLTRLAAAADRAAVLGIELADGPLVVIKEVNGTHAAALVMDMFPRSRMLLLLRDGRDVVDSRAHAVGGSGFMVHDRPAFESEAERAAWFHDACLEWASQIEVGGWAHDHHPEKLRRRLRYEDLLAAPEKELGELLAWLGLPCDEDRVAAIVAAHAFERVPASERGPTRRARRASPGLWRENLSATEQRLASQIMGSRLEALGYDV